jgi:hypothetical protein
MRFGNLMAAAVLCVLAGCVTPTARENGEDACNMIFFATLHSTLPLPPAMYGAICTFGIRQLPDEKKEKEE